MLLRSASRPPVALAELGEAGAAAAAATAQHPIVQRHADRGGVVLGPRQRTRCLELNLGPLDPVTNPSEFMYLLRFFWFVFCVLEWLASGLL